MSVEAKNIKFTIDGKPVRLTSIKPRDISLIEENDDVFVKHITKIKENNYVNDNKKNMERV